jgi:hypothetical protein
VESNHSWNSKGQGTCQVAKAKADK